MTSPGLSMWIFLSSAPTLHCGEDAWLKGEGSLPHTLTRAHTHTHTSTRSPNGLPRKLPPAASSCPGLTGSAPPRAWCRAALQGAEERTLRTGLASAALPEAVLSTATLTPAHPVLPRDPEGLHPRGLSLQPGCGPGPSSAPHALWTPPSPASLPPTSTPDPQRAHLPPAKPSSPGMGSRGRKEKHT